MTSRRSRTAVAAVVVIACALWSHGSASANFIGESYVYACDRSQETEPCLADNSVHRVFMDVGPNYRAAINATLYQSWDTTDVDVVDAHGAHGSTDVYYSYRDLPGARLGQTNCITLSADQRFCDHFHVTLDRAAAIEWGWGDGTRGDQQVLKTIACHETGHTLGLYHVVDEPSVYRCMTTPISEMTPSTVGPHNANHMRYYR